MLLFEDMELRRNSGSLSNALHRAQFLLVHKIRITPFHLR